MAAGRIAVEGQENDSRRGMDAPDGCHDAWSRMKGRHDVNHTICRCQRGYLHSINFAMEVEIGTSYFWLGVMIIVSTLSGLRFYFWLGVMIVM